MRWLFLEEWMILTQARTLIKHNNYKGDLYCERLIKEWLQHGKIILAIDFDSTISYWKTVENQKDIERCIHVIHQAQQVGTYNVIWTACNPDRYKEISMYCKQNRIQVEAINETPIKEIPYGKHKKIFYNHLLDDRTSLPEALDRLEYCLYRVRSEKFPVTSQTVEF